MKLSQKIKHYKRHRQNKKIADTVTTLYRLALRMELPEPEQNIISFYISPLMYEVMRANYHYIPHTITHSGLIENDRFVTTTREWIDTTLNCPNGMPYVYTDIKPDYLNEIGLRPSVLAAVPSVTVKEV